jgi:hypothetical protein
MCCCCVRVLRIAGVALMRAGLSRGSAVDLVVGVSDFLVSPSERRMLRAGVAGKRHLAGDASPNVLRVRGGPSDAVVEMALFCPVRWC